MNAAQDDFITGLVDRRLLAVTGADAFDFLQNIITNDMNLLTTDKMIYACLLSPQGQWLHDFFIMQDDAGGFVLDVEKTSYDAFLRRLMVFKLRAKVSLLADDETKIYAAKTLPEKNNLRAYPDPRLPELGLRLYTKQTLPVDTANYDDLCISWGIPCGSKTIVTGRDVMADVNLDFLQAVAWDKGCFIGQEVAARMYHRNLSKKRLFIVTGAGLETGMALAHDGVEAGQIRQVSREGGQGLAVIKTAILSRSDDHLATASGITVYVRKPPYLNLS